MEKKEEKRELGDEDDTLPFNREDFQREVEGLCSSASMRAAKILSSAKLRAAKGVK